MPADRRVVLTRTPEDNEALRAALDDVDVAFVDHPCIALERLPLDAFIRERLEGNRYGAAVFTSRGGVEALLSQVEAEPPSTVVAIGPATAEALSARGWRVTAMPSEAYSEVAAREVEGSLHGDALVLHVRGEVGLPHIPNALRALGYEVDEAVVYRTVDPQTGPLPADPRPTLVVFASPSAVRNFVAHSPVEPTMEALAIGVTTEKAAREAGFPTRVAERPDVAGLAEAVRAWVRS